MTELHRRILALGFMLCLLFVALPLHTEAHAALERSDPAAGTSLENPPDEIRIWFTEPLEQAFTGADLLEASGEPVAGVSVSIAPDNAHELVLDVPEGLAPGSYTVAWRTLSSADGHTLDGYFGFQVGTALAGSPVAGELAATGGDRLRPLSRGVALIGLAALLSIAPLILGMFDPLAHTQPVLGLGIVRGLRRYAVLASGLALLGSLFALVAQARAIAPDASAFTALGQTLSDTRYGQLWLWRIALLLAVIALVAVALRPDSRWRRPALAAAMLVSLAAPLPFSLLSHAAAQTEGRASAVASDAIHLLFASLWAGGLFMLALVLVPAIWRAEPRVRNAALWVAIARFSILGVAAWAVLLVSGLYASWLQVGTLAALRETDYGQTLLLKGALLLPALVLAAFHFILGWRGASGISGERLTRTLIVEACIVVAVLLVVGRLIGLEPAREVIASQTPGELRLALDFPADGETRRGWLTISPGVAGNNQFTVEVEGAALPGDSEAVLRFALPDQNIGQQELRLPAAGPNTFRAEGSELSLTGEWDVTAIVRRIGGFSWRTDLSFPLGSVSPAAPPENPAPHFDVSGVAGMVALAIGMAGLAAAVLARGSSAPRRLTTATLAIIVVIAGSVALREARLPGVSVPVAGQARDPVTASTPIATPAETPEPSHAHHRAHATPELALNTAGPGTPVVSNGLTVTIETEADGSSPADLTVIVSDDNTPVTGARVAVLSEMPAMDGGQETTAASEVAPGRYLASGVPMTMPGEWRLAVRISPKGGSTRIVSFSVDAR